MFVAEYWTAGLPDDVNDDAGEGMTVDNVSDDPNKLIDFARAELKARFQGSGRRKYRVRNPEPGYSLVEMRWRDAGEPWTTYFVIRPINVL